MAKTLLYSSGHFKTISKTIKINAALKNQIYLIAISRVAKASYIEFFFLVKTSICHVTNAYVLYKAVKYWDILVTKMFISKGIFSPVKSEI